MTESETEMRKGRVHSVQERARIMDDLDKLVANGQHLRDAVKLAGIHLTTYYAWKKQMGRKANRAKRGATPRGATPRGAGGSVSRHVVESILTDPVLTDSQRVKMLAAYCTA